jgi:HEAT repeat protein
LPDAPPERLVPELLKLLNDPDALVRTCAAENLGLFPSQQVRHALTAFLEYEQDEVARLFGLESLGEVAELEDLGFLLEKVENPAGIRSGIGAHLGLFVATRRVAIDFLLAHVSHEDFAIRASATRALGSLFELAEADNNRIVATLRTQLDKESEADVGIREAITDVLSYLESEQTDC